MSSLLEACSIENLTMDHSGYHVFEKEQARCRHYKELNFSGLPTSPYFSSGVSSYSCLLPHYRVLIYYCTFSGSRDIDRWMLNNQPIIVEAFLFSKKYMFVLCDTQTVKKIIVLNKNSLLIKVNDVDMIHTFQLMENVFF